MKAPGWEKERGALVVAGNPPGDRPNDAGSVTLWLVIMTVALMAAIGLVYDGGEALAVKGQAISAAYGAARAGAESLDQAAFARRGPAMPDPYAAQSAAQRFLTAAGVPPDQATVSVNGPVVTVTVRMTSPATILGAVGAGPFRVTGQGHARAIYGVKAPRP